MKTLITLFFLIFSLLLSAQASWINYANDHIVWDFALENDQLWVATQGGLIKIDTQNGDKQIFQAWNSGLRGTGLKEVEVAEDGTKWFGGENGGLFSFDDTNWEQFYYINTGDTLIEILNLKLDPSGNPWFFSNQNGNCSGCKKFISYDGTAFQNHDENLQFTFATGRIQDFDFINTEELWVASSRRIVKYNGNEITETYDDTIIPLIEDENIQQIETDLQGNLWATTSNYAAGDYAYRIIKFDGTSWTIENEEAPGWAYQFFQDDDGNLWGSFHDSNTFERTYGAYDGTEWNFWTGTDLPEIPDSSYRPALHWVDVEGNWWVISFSGTFEPKVYRYDGTSYTAYDTEIYPLGTHYYNDVIADCDNNIWLNGRSSLSKFDGNNWENFLSTATGFSGTAYDAVIDPNNCNMWIALYSGDEGDADVVRYNGEVFETFLAGNGSALSIDIDLDGTVYVATTQRGLMQYDGVWTIFDESNSPLNDYVSSVRVQSDGTVWVASYGEGIARKIGEEWTVFDSSNSPIDNYASRIHLDNDDNIWVRSGAGLAKYDGTDWEVFSFDLTPSGVNCITQDALGNYWLGTQSGALYWDGANYIVYDVSNSDIGTNSIREILIDSLNGDIWFLNSRGASVLSGFQVGPSISGIVFYDANQDGVFDSSEDVRLPNHQVFLFPDSTNAITNSFGAYRFYPEGTDNYKIIYDPPAPYQPTSPTLLDTFYQQESITDMNFGVWAEDVPTGVSIDIVTSPVVCNNEMSVWVTFRNEGFLAIAGEITLSFAENFTYASSYPEVTTNEVDQVTWSFTDLGFMEARTYRLNLIAPGVDDLEETFLFAASITADGQNPSARTVEELLCSYDPNDKTAVPLGESIDEYSLLTDPLQYIIRFQNMGNYLAKDVVVSDFLDPHLDISTFQVISSSHEMTTTIGLDREVVFRFTDINLPPEEEDQLGSQGYIKYQIMPLPGLADPTFIYNTANIYFDLNPAIVTNTTKNILVESLIVDRIEEGNATTSLASVYPNPARTAIWIDWQENDTPTDWQAAVYDLSGKLLFQQQTSGARAQIVLPQKGVYLLKIQKGDYLQVEKIVIIGF